MKNGKRTMSSRYKYDSLFCLCIVGIFIIQWLVFWVGGNLNSIRLAFTEFDVNSESHVLLPANNLFSNFKKFVGDVFAENVGGYVLNGVVMHLISVVICLPLSFMIAFILYKKLPGSGLYKILLYLPSILSTMVTVLLYKHFIEGFVGTMWYSIFNESMGPVFRNPDYDWLVVSIYIVFFGIAGNLLINLGTMSRIPPDLIEYGELEGISLFKEFCMITLPLMYPVIQVQCLGLFVGFFTTQGPLYAIYSGNAPDNIQTFGYYLFTSVYQGRGGVRPEFMYGYNSAANLLIGIVSVPIVQATKWLFDKFDPGAEF